eukprot:8951842-Prorocentrum_lima.AAC.1
MCIRDRVRCVPIRSCKTVQDLRRLQQLTLRLSMLCFQGCVLLDQSFKRLLVLVLAPPLVIEVVAQLDDAKLPARDSQWHALVREQNPK